MVAKPASRLSSFTAVCGRFGLGRRLQILKRKGYNVLVVQNPTKTLADDVAGHKGRH
jgi:hypothetical protein